MLLVNENELVCIADLRGEKEVDEAALTRIVPAPDMGSNSKKDLVFLPEHQCHLTLPKQQRHLVLLEPQRLVAQLEKQRLCEVLEPQRMVLLPEQGGHLILIPQEQGQLVLLDQWQLANLPE